MCRLSRSAKCIWREDFWNRAPTVWTSLWRTPAAWPSPAPPSPSTSPRTHLVSYTNTYNRIFLEISFVETVAWCVVVSGLFLHSLHCPLYPSVSTTSHTAQVVLSSSAVLGAIFAFIAYVVYKWVVFRCSSIPSVNVWRPEYMMQKDFNAQLCLLLPH